MKATNLIRCILSFASAVLAACGGSQPPIGATPQSRAIATHAERGGSWMLPEAKSEPLVYVANGTVYVYAYGTSKLVGTLALAPIGDTGYECSDMDGNVFVPVLDGTSKTGVYEYAHGGATPINYLSVPGARACAIDPVTGDLAVINGGPTIYIFPNASGSPEMYTDNNIYLSTDVAYGNSGNLFIDGWYHGGGFALIELLASSSEFQDITVQGSEDDANGQNSIEWDGKFLGLGSYRTTKRTRSQEVVQRLAIAGSSAMIVGYTPLGPQREPAHLQFWVNESVAIQVSNKPSSHSLIQYFKYPQGKLTRSLRVQPFGAPYGITVSVAPSR